MTQLYSTFPQTFHTEFENLFQWAQTQEIIHIGTPGRIEERLRGADTFFYHRFYDANGNQIEKYIGGPAGSPDGDLARKNAMERISSAEMIVQNVKNFRKLGFAVIEAKAGATLAALHNHELFSKGLTLIGSHAYGAILNRLGVMAPNYLTEDIDTVRSNPLNLATTPQINLLEILKTSGLPFLKTKTNLKPGDKSETYKLAGKEKLLVDLLVNGPKVGAPIFVPELEAYAQSVPHLNYLVNGRLESIILSKHYAIPVYTPNPAQFAVHKLFSATSRVNQSAKSDKDILQAATVICAVEDKYPGDIEDALNAFPPSGMRLMLKGAERAMPFVQSHSEQHGDDFRRAIDRLS
ncbi:MAG: nucleotidyltransferase domain-containing protein [Burkholderiaceae bacterium]|nr:nucleotidyltransferase domain-containing protein [Burkholderiaceae bacterium]